MILGVIGLAVGAWFVTRADVDDRPIAEAAASATTVSVAETSGPPETVAIPTTTDNPTVLPVNVLTVDVREAVTGFEGALDLFEAETGILVEVQSTNGSPDLRDELIDAGEPPDIAIVHGPATVVAYAERGLAVPLSTHGLSLFEDNFGSRWAEQLTHDGDVYGIPVRADVKSLVWYSPSIWAERGYQVPETWADLAALMEEMRSNGDTPWGVGIESSGATGWMFTDWMENLILRLHGTEAYDAWASHEVPFHDPRAREAAAFVDDLWFGEDNVLGSREDVVNTPFGEAGLCVVDGRCMMHHQGWFYQRFLSDWEIGPNGDAYVFVLPAPDGEEIVLTSGTFAVAFDDRPEVAAVMEYLAAAEFANARIGGLERFMSANRGQDTSLYPSVVESEIAEILMRADVVRVDASDQMPTDVVLNAFWPAATDYVAGTIDVDEFLAAVEAAWP